MFVCGLYFASQGSITRVRKLGLPGFVNSFTGTQPQPYAWCCLWPLFTNTAELSHCDQP